MKKYIYTKSSTLLVVEDSNFEKFSLLENDYGSIDWLWTIEEDGEFIFNDKKYNVKAGDIVLCLYEENSKSRGGRIISIVQNDTWYKNIKASEKYCKEEAECCDCCPDCSSEA